MTNYPLSAYGTTNPNAGKNANGDTAAWGGYEWPNCPPSSLIASTNYTSKFGQVLKVSVRKELVELETLFFKLADKHNYCIYASVGGENWGPWGGQCRSVSGGNTPSGHSKWLSTDINAPYNPYSYTFQSDIPPALVADLEAIGFYWGGRYKNQKYDPMHFGFCWKPSDVARFVAKAKELLGEADDDMDLTPQNLDDIANAVVKKLRGTADTYTDSYFDWTGKSATRSLSEKDSNIQQFNYISGIFRDTQILRGVKPPAK